MKEVLQELVSMQVKMSIGTVLVAIGIAIIVALIIYLTYKHTYTGVLYNQRFNVSLIMITLITTMVMVVIGSNISVSLGMVGALSIIRFRTAVKDPRDTAFIFWAIVTGLACGTQNYTIVLVGSALICGVLFIFKKVCAANDKYSLIIKGKNISPELIDKVIAKLIKDYIVKGKYINNNSVELIYEVKLKKTNPNRLIEQISSIEGIDVVNLVSNNTDTLG